MQLYVAGSLALDRIMNFPGKFADHILPDKIHILNVCFLLEGLNEYYGGTAGNIAYNLSMLGEKPLILACAGKDFAPYAERLKGLGLPLEGVRIVDSQFTAGAYITTDETDNQITGFNPGAMRERCGYAFPQKHGGPVMGIVSPTNVNDMIELPAYFKKAGIPYIFDPGQQITALSGAQMAEAIEGSFALCTNDYELELVMKATGFSRAELLKRTGALVTTLGEQGSIIAEGTKETKVAPVKVDKALDPTGAGDAFRAGMLKGLCLGQSLPQAAELGSVCAAFCVAKKGTQEHSFTMDAFNQSLTTHFGRSI
ncbi:MAG TPA: carbohydrate kinase family protein [Humidesulfovibrio sp.]|uniref:carbohydrate kinase family protein n=1 Tax=Humidesulfovibrio sp. TaxID=2910988 RepID=UPI002C79FB87|nr:carbohydrate kinase family protein [Humidesulfovibrio sp.]HWR02863.1 carbohydrate kinase family protein [Humidesulfovibrio sp.]